MQASESVCTENARYTKLEAPEIIRDRVVIANHQRGELRWVEMLRGHTRDVVGRYTFDTRHEFGEITAAVNGLAVPIEKSPADCDQHGPQRQQSDQPASRLLDGAASAPIGPYRSP